MFADRLATFLNKNMLVFLL